MQSAGNIDEKAAALVLSSLFSDSVGVSLKALGDREYAIFESERVSIRNAIPRRRIEYSTGRECARRAMVAIGHRPTPIPCGEDRAPIWPTDLVGSITHGGGVCAAAVASSKTFRSIGIDVEAVGSVPVELKHDIITEEEWQGFADEPSGIDGLTLCFCIKEAAYKAFYPIRRKMLDFLEMKIEIASSMEFKATASPKDGNAGASFLGRAGVTQGLVFATCWHTVS